MKLFRPPSIRVFIISLFCLGATGCFQNSTSSQSKGGSYDLTGQIAQLVTSKLSALVGIGSGKTIYVSTSGDDDHHSCTDAQSELYPKRTISAGIACLTGGDTLVIGDGVYNERVCLGQTYYTNCNIPSGTPNAPTIVRAKNQRQAIIQPDDSILKPLEDPYWSWGVLYFSKPGSHDVIFDGLVMDASLTTGAPCAAGAGNSGLEPNNPQHDVTFRNGTCRGSSVGPDGTGAVAMGLGTHVDFVYKNVSDYGYKVQNMEIHGVTAANPDYSGYGIYLVGQDSLIENTEIYDTTCFGITVYDFVPVNNAVIRNNRIHDVGKLHGSCSPGIEVSRGSNTQIYNNLIYNGGGYGIWIGYGNIGSHVYNNTVYGSTFGGIAVSDYSGAPQNLDIENNILIANGWGPIIDWGVNTTCRFNLGVSGGEGSTSRCSDSSSGANPFFVNSAAGDFHLQSGSPAINAGTDVGVTTDLDGNRRDSQPDLGAYEYGATGGGGGGGDESPTTDCRMTVPSCPNYPETPTTEFSDDYEGAASSQSRCMQRAQDYYDWCGTSDPVTARYLVDGSLVDQTTYPFTTSTPTPTATPIPTPTPFEDTSPPSVVITSPRNGEVFTRRSSVTIQAVATDNVAVEQTIVYVNGAIVCEVPSASASCNWRVPPGPAKTYEIKASARDSSGNIGNSAVITILSR